MLYAKKLSELKEQGLYREFRTINSSSSNVIRFKGREFIMFAGNNYFGLNTHLNVINEVKKAVEKYGTGNTASRLIVNLDLHEKLEKEIAEYKRCESALVYSSGYSANLGIVSSVVGEGDIILSDELNHASIIDGCRLSKAGVFVYTHCNVMDLEEKLSKLRNKKILVITDSVFSMDGDIAPLNKIISLKKKYRFVLMVDDAHATGVINTNLNGIDIYMGTLSKALASQGGFVAGSKEIIDYLRNTSRSFMFSTGISPPDTAGALASLQILKRDKSLREKLLWNANYLRNGLKKLGFDVGGELQIIPLIIGDVKKTMESQKLLEKEGIFVTGIRPPTVRTARLRISVMATHTKEQLNMALSGFEKLIGRV